MRSAACRPAVCTLCLQCVRRRGPPRAECPGSRAIGARTRGPETEARACATHGRERAQLATRIAACRLPRRLSLHGQETGGGARSRLGRGGARHGRTRSQSPLFSAPCTQRRGHRVWCVRVCQMLLSRRPTVMAAMQTGDALAAPPQCCGNEGLWGIAHGSPSAPLSRTRGAHRVRRVPQRRPAPTRRVWRWRWWGGSNYRTFRIAFFAFLTQVLDSLLRGWRNLPWAESPKRGQEKQLSDGGG